MYGQLKTTVLLVTIFTCFSAQASLQQLQEAAMKEGRLNTATMPDDWANWKQTWRDMKEKYNIAHRDTDMGSAELIAKIRAEKKMASIDLGDSGFIFCRVAKSLNLTQPYKTTTWEDIPGWAKDPDGHWVLSYTGTIAFIINKEKVRHIPQGWKDLLDSKEKVAIGNVGHSGQPTNAVLSAAMAMGGDETNLMPGIELFANLAKQKRLMLIEPSITNLERGEIEIGLLWDFNALSYRKMINPDRFEVLIPEEGSVISGYSTLINKWAKHPNAAKLAREYILSDAGQLNLARGFARPIRNIGLPEEVQKRLLPEEQYKKAKRITNLSAWQRSVRELHYHWQEKVLIYLN